MGFSDVQATKDAVRGLTLKKKTLLCLGRSATCDLNCDSSSGKRSVAGDASLAAAVCEADISSIGLANSG